MSKKLSVQNVLGISSADATHLLGTLTGREQEVAALMADGLKNTKIAKQLKISTKTLDIHRANLKRKLKAGTSVAVARVVLAEKFGQYVS